MSNASFNPFALRACECITAWVHALVGRERVRVAVRDRRTDFCLECENSEGGRTQALRRQYVVGEGEPERDGTDLGAATHGELTQVPVSEPGVNAFADRAALR